MEVRGDGYAPASSQARGLDDDRDPAADRGVHVDRARRAGDARLLARLLGIAASNPDAYGDGGTPGVVVRALVISGGVDAQATLAWHAARGTRLTPAPSPN